MPIGARPSGEWMYSARHRILGHERPGVAVMHPALTATELKVPTVTNGMRHLVSTLWTQNYAVFEERALFTPVRGVKTELAGAKMCECSGEVAGSAGLLQFRLFRL